MKIPMMNSLKGVVVAVAVGLFAWSSTAVLASTSNCASNGYSTAPHLTCSGDCDGTACPDPPSGSGSNQQHGAYQYCKCPSEVGEQTCCHLIMTTGGGDVYVNGECNVGSPCPTQPVCKRVGAGTSVSPWTRACTTD